MRRLLTWLSPTGLHGQVAGILLLGLVLSQAMAALLYIALLPQWQKVLRPELAVTKVAMIVRLLESVSQTDRPALAKLWDDEGFRVAYFVDAGTPATPGATASASDEELREQIVTSLHRSGSAVTVQTIERGSMANSKRIDVSLRGGGAVELVTAIGLESRLGHIEQVAIVAFLLFATGGLWAWSTWAVNRPLNRFSNAAERVGLDVHAPVLPEQGPAELRRAIRAFNEMQARLRRYVDDRTSMVAAIAHDLRTPLTRLRFRVEAAPEEARAKMNSDIDQMEAMIAATLVFVATKLFRVDELHTILHFDRLEFALAAVTILVVGLVGIEQGVLLAMILSLADRTRRTLRPRDTLLGRDPGTDHWIPRDIGRPTEEVPGVLVYLVYAPLWYGNADYFRSRIRQLLRAHAGRVRTVIIDADAMSDIDYTGLQALRGLATELGLSGVALGIARASHIVHHDLKHGSLIEQLGADHLFASVDDAVAGLRRQA